MNVLKPQNGILFVQRLVLENKLIVSHLTKKTLVTKGSHIQCPSYEMLRVGKYTKKVSRFVTAQS